MGAARLAPPAPPLAAREGITPLQPTEVPAERPRTPLLLALLLLSLALNAYLVLSYPSAAAASPSPRRQLRPRPAQKNQLGTSVSLNFSDVLADHCGSTASCSPDELQLHAALLAGRGCESYPLCSVSAASRGPLLQEPLYDPRANKSVFSVPLSPLPLHVPMMKLHAAAPAAAPWRTPPRARVPYANKSSPAAVCARGCSEESQLYAAWPERKLFDRLAWERLGTPHAAKFRHCGPAFHWYCGHLHPSYLGYHQAVYYSCYRRIGVFDRADVRLVLDIGGASAAMAQVLHDVFGDAIVTITGAFWSTMMDGGYNHIAPVAQVAAARGFPVVMVDAFGYLPFAENTLDVVHASWVYHSGVPTATVYEFYRVLRPGGFLVLRQAINADATFRAIKAIALKEKWRLHWEVGGCGTHGAVIVWQMPVF
ncbi:hypothetical protein AB1Y20_014685 [Prymnesium parvum]|uniref:Methyltransferase type 11 domain-containing protein n=1 Tax=Prymnesium parvum TaxID=97485 RepID=A0AB34IC61_PRYPA